MSTDGPRSGRHQLIAARLRQLLVGAAPPGYVALESVPWLPSGASTPLLPDVAVVALPDVSLGPVHAVPLLAAEVLDPTENPVDLLERYASAGLRHLWTVDAATSDLTVYLRVGDALVVGAVAQPGSRLRVRDPFSVALDPAELTRST